MKAFALAVLGSIALLFLTGCPEQKTIADLMADPGRYTDEEVRIEGRVTNSFGALGRGAFEVDDGTGRIWVLSENEGVPSNDARVHVSGRIVQGVTFSGRSFATVLRQSDRRASGERR